MPTTNSHYLHSLNTVYLQFKDRQFTKSPINHTLNGNKTPMPKLSPLVINIHMVFGLCFFLYLF